MPNKIIVENIEFKGSFVYPEFKGKIMNEISYKKCGQFNNNKSKCPLCKTYYMEGDSCE